MPNTTPHAAGAQAHPSGHTGPQERPWTPLVAVVGGGVSGLLTARRVRQGGARVVLLEARERLGGHVRTVEVAGHPVDVGAESLHLGSPQAGALVEELGLADAVVAARPGSSRLWTPRGHRRLPAGVGPSGPTRLGPVLRSGVLTPAGIARAGLEPLAARRCGPLDLSPGHDVSVGAFVGARFGPEVLERILDPVLGGLHSADVGTLSLRACAPGLLAAACSGRSVLLASRAGRRAAGGPGGAVGAGSPGGPTPPMFASFPGGLSTLVAHLLDDVDVEVRRGSGVRHLEPIGIRGPAGASARYRVTLADGTTIAADAIVLAVPAAVAGRLLGAWPEAAAPLGAIRTASTATVVLGFDREELAGLSAFDATGLLVPSVTGSLLKAATFLSAKWAHLEDPATFLLRVSAGRGGDDTVERLTDADLVEVLRRDLRRFTGLAAEPTHLHVERWRPGLPQLTVGHPDRIAAARASLQAQAPGIVLAGASYDGVGLSSCLASAERAARATLTAVGRN